jgi:RNA polymerase sigma-70 factor (ECF subfamily)
VAPDEALRTLMQAAQAGNQSAYAALLRACGPIAAAGARAKGIPHDRIEDVVQDVLLTIHRARATYDPARPFLPWLRAIVMRRAADHLRDRYRHAPARSGEEDALAAQPDPSPGADDTLAAARETQALGDAIATLPAAQRQAIELLGLRERTLAEASAETGRSQVALKVNLHRALASLRGRLAPAAKGETDG